MIGFAAAAALLSGSGAGAYSPKGPLIDVKMASGGSFTIQTDPKHSPKTVAWILHLVRSGFYNRQRIHRVEYWVVQWGAPASKNQPLMVKDKSGKMVLSDAVGDGGSGHTLPFEMCDVDFMRGVVGVASDGLQNGGDSQLFVLKGDRQYLWHSYAVVGKVIQGMDVVDHIKFGDRILRMRVQPIFLQFARGNTPRRRATRRRRRSLFDGFPTSTGEVPAPPGTEINRGPRPHKKKK